MIYHKYTSAKHLYSKIKNKKVSYGGNINLKIYGKLNCKSGKRMKKENRIFFSSKEEALIFGFIPCGHCMKTEYNEWKNEVI
ncbi:Ada metal-binding domain-containing protein [Flavivirga sp. 57AJ16]|uniref:Ada metal-binding domain-containing protein n=1 Tax=Flavivirga sp. 57AJ16 TaxID=3025307 RepID=UPI00236587C3|nr:Ada metal-binding domain-containing protein [Flavivirga sp. 57AJ16]MDD7886183.1 Ada metal-binding domain-containing protein [Flavivirga sp. 57AJ16]